MTEEIRKILAKADDFYEDALYLFQGARYGGVINRSYYAMFTIAQGLLLSEKQFSKTHQGTMVKFHDLFIKTGRLPVVLGRTLNETYEKRQFGDYDIDATITREDAEKVLMNANFFIERLKEYLGE